MYEYYTEQLYSIRKALPNKRKNVAQDMVNKGNIRVEGHKVVQLATEVHKIPFHW